MVKQIGDTSRDGSLVIADTKWNGDGVLIVNIRSVDDVYGPINVSKARTLARAALEHPEKTRSTHIVKRYTCEASIPCEHITFAVSRLAS